LTPKPDGTFNIARLTALIPTEQEHDVPAVFGIVDSQSSADVDLQLVHAITYVPVISEISGTDPCQPGGDRRLHLFVAECLVPVVKRNGPIGELDFSNLSLTDPTCKL